jgi:hypothetical protein
MVFDFIKDPIKRLSAAQQSLRKTDMGRGGVIKVELDPSTNAIKYVISATGERLDSPQEAFIRASSLMMTQFESLRAASGSVSNLVNNPNNPKYAQVGEILSEIQSKLQNVDPATAAKLKAMGIDISSIGTDVSANIIASKTQKGSRPKDFLEAIRKMSETGPNKGGFIPFIDEEGANLLQFKVGAKILSDEETYYMLSVIGNPIFNQEKFASIFSSDKPIDAFMEKITKRMKGLISERDITITEDTLRAAFGGKDPKALVIEEGLDILKKQFGLGDANSLQQKAIAHIDSETILNKSLGNIVQDPQSFIDNVLKRADVKKIISGSTTNVELLDSVKGILSNDDYKVFKQFMDDAEKEFDGIAVLNSRVIYANDKKSQGVIRQLDDQINQLKQDIASSNSPANKQQLMQKLEQLQQRRNVIGGADNIYQITGRGSYEGAGIKTAFDVRNLGRDFEDVSMIIGRSGMKKEIGLAGSKNFITISGFGASSSSVYADPVSIAFNPEIFSSPEELQSIRQYSAQVMQDFQQAVESDVLPEKIRNMLNRNLTEDLSNMPASVRSAKVRNQEYARRIIELHQSGIGPKQSPEMMNLLHSTFASEAFRMTTKEGQARYLPTMPNVFRFAVSTETAGALGGGELPILGKGIENINFKLAGQDQAAELLKFRISNGRLFFGAGSVPEFFQSLGGFDLDDKGLPRLMTYDDVAGNRRLAFSLTRQPSGVQESIMASAKLNDANTLRALFGEKEDFLQTLRSITVSGTLEETLLNSITGSGGVNFSSIKEEDVGTVIQNVYTKMGRSIGKMDDRMLQNLVDYGPSALRNTDLYSRSSVYKIFQDEGAFDFTLGSQMEDLVDKYRNGLDPGLYGQIKNALSITDEKTKRQALTQLINNSSDDQGLQALLTHSVFRKMETAALEPGNILGVYVNRTMVVGSTLNQFDDYINLIEGNAQINDDLKNILRKQIGLVSSETAIDTSVNYSSSTFVAKIRNTMELAQDAINAGGSEADIQRAALKTLGYSDETILKGLNIDLVGEQSIASLGERIGAATALMTSQEFGGQFDASLRPVIDQILLEDRLSNGDIQTLLDNIRKGIQDARGAQTLTGAELDQLEEDLLKVKPSPSEIRATLGRIFGASKDHKYASLVKLNSIGEQVSAQFDLIKRLNLTNMPQDHILSATNVSDEARKVAEVLLDKHSEDYQAVTARLLNESAEHEKYLADEGRYRLGQKVYEDITGAQQITGLSRGEIITAVDKVSAERSSLNRQREMDLSRLYYLDDENFAGQVTTARVRRQAEALRVTAGDLEEQVLNSLTSSKQFTGITEPSQAMGIIDEYFKNMLGSTTTSAEQKYLAQAALDQSIEGASPEEAELARQRARVVRVQATNQALQQDQATMQAVTATGQSTFTGDDNLRKSINAAINDEDYTKFLGAKGKYVRFSEYLKSGELKNLFKNNNLFKNSVYATGALIVGSFAYQGFKDHTPEKMQGPPMLPGGSAYEGQYPSRASQIPQIGTVSYNPGVSYKVNLYGNRNEVRQFQDMAMGLGNFDMDTTMYSGIPQVGTDPYQQLASSY